ncbi:MAG: 50S ribosomal protein L17 [Candidatus Pacebacteria bacterium]|jgi:large subunit ribosomal protein L17|nr:50S ribosomal protein L17 [Candidatus Paceibacterota bacterium]
MRHHNANRKFGRTRSQRKALLEGLIVSLVRDEKIMTTEAKAKEIRPMVEKLITRAQSATLANRRLISTRLGNQPTTAKKLIEEIAPKYTDRTGGYTRITKLPARLGDASPRAIIEFV